MSLSTEQFYGFMEGRKGEEEREKGRKKQKKI
jgi:hypothetical protein